VSLPASLRDLLARAIDARRQLIDDRHESAFRILNGFLEGASGLVVEVYSRTLVLLDHSDPPDVAGAALSEIQSFLLERLPWAEAVLIKARHAHSPELRLGLITHGAAVATRIIEHGVRYALDLRLNQDTSFYIDTRELRRWLKLNLGGMTVLNTFAYSGSLGVAAMAGGAARVQHVDRNRRFLSLAKQSCALNGFVVRREDFVTGDFHPVTARLRRARQSFDCVIVDPPFFSETARGRIDMAAESHRILNKARPLVRDGGFLIAINNALYLSGADYMGILARLCADGYMAIEAVVPVPEDCTGGPAAARAALPVDPAPFNHSTKIAILRIRRKG